MQQKIFIKTFGCQMNEYDSNRIYDAVREIGFEKTVKYENIPKLCEKLKVEKNLLKPIYLS